MSKDSGKNPLKKGNCDPLRVPVARPTSSVRSGYLLKRGELNKSWKKRWFILSDHFLYYYKNREDQKYQGTIQLLFSSFRVESLNNFKIITPSRVFYLQAEVDNEAKLWIKDMTTVCEKLWKEENELGRNSQEASSTGNNIGKEGCLHKMGNNLVKDWKPRWFVVKRDSIDYFKNRGDFEPLGSISLLQCSVKQSDAKKFCLEFITPNRTYYAYAKDEKDMNEWMEAVKKAITGTLETFFEQGEKKSPRSLASSSSSEAINGSDNAQNTALYSSIKSSASIEGKNSLSNPSVIPDSDSNISSLLNSTSSNNNSLLGSTSLHTTFSCHELLLETVMQPCNRICAECQEPNPKWASINLGVVVCIKCSGIHRSLGVHLSKVRSVDLDVWEMETIEFFASMGNAKAKQIWEHHVLPEYESKRPLPTSPRALKEEWITTKYVKKLFADPDIIKVSDQPAQQNSEKEESQAPYKEGYLTKQSPKEDLFPSWKRRWFILKDDYLYYYITKEDQIPIGAIRLESAKIKVSPGSSRSHCFEIVTSNRDYVISADDSSEMFSWMNTLQKSVKYITETKNERKSRRPTDVADSSQKRVIVDFNPQSVRMKGYLYKKGANFMTEWKKRWFIAYETSLYYYQTENDKIPLGIIELTPEVSIYQHMKEDSHKNHKKYFFDMETQGRVYYLHSDNLSEYEEWICTIGRMISATKEKL